MVHDLGNEALTFFDLNERVNCELDELAVTDIAQILVNTLVEKEDLLEQVIESLDDLKVALFETFVQLAVLY